VFDALVFFGKHKLHFASFSFSSFGKPDIISRIIGLPFRGGANEKAKHAQVRPQSTGCGSIAGCNHHDKHRRPVGSG
jgi:hypothetical protein